MDLTVSCNAACLWTPQSSSRNLRTLLSLISAPRSVAPRSLAFTDRCSQSSAIATSWKDRAMPSSQFDPLSIEEKALTDSDPLISFRLNESTFLASLMPKKEIGADRFLSSYPTYDGRGVVIAIFDSGVDPAAAGLQKTSDGKPKILDILDCTGSGDVDTSKIVKADANGYITGASGERLLVNSSWKNPSQEWHIGCKLVYELFTDTLTSRIKKERKKKWDAINQEAISQAVKNLNEFDKKYPKNEDSKLKRVREDLQNKFDFLKKMDDGYDDRGPVIDVVAWNDGNLWRVAIDTQSFEDSSEQGKLANFVPLTNYRIERKYGIFSKLDACSFVTNVYDDGNIVSLVTDCSPHGTHVAGIASAFHPEESLLNGVAPGAQLISCKIGDTRLGSMETGTGLTRALIAALEHKCDLINMSYGEPTLLPDYGRFVDLVNEAVDKHHLIFISSAGNSGPALSTVGAPGGTSSRIVGIGAYVSPAMAAGAHSVVEPFPEGMEYTWSSRGPTADGDLGVCISAPGAAVAPVPTWTLQRRMLMNGTSMASPSACGGVALLVSAMKAEGIFISPYTVRKALENTATPISDLLVEKLTTGQGLMQVDRAYDYIQRSKDLPSVYYKVLVTPAGKSTPISRGIYLRGGCSSQHSTEVLGMESIINCKNLILVCLERLDTILKLEVIESLWYNSAWTIKVEPSFHEGENNHEELVSFEERIQLYSTAKSVALAPEYLLLTHNGRTFNIVVDPSMVNHGLHFHEVYGIDCKAPWRGPLFRVPITIIKPVVPVGQPPLISISGLSFFHGHIERRFIDVPVGATWAVATMRAAGFDTSRKFFIDAVQICPLKRPIKWESQVTFSSPSLKSFLIPVKGGLIMELTIAQFWSSGIGSHESTLCDFEIAFHGIKISRESVILDGSEASARIEAKSFLDAEKLVPSATLTKIKTSYRPLNTNISTLTWDRDKLPSGKQILCLTLIYKFKLDEGGEVKPLVPLLNNRIYDTKFESQFYTISDPNNRIYAFGDAYPKYVKIPKGEYTLKLNIRHDDVKVLEKLKQLVLFLERKLDKKEHICLSFFSQPDGHCLGNSAFTSLNLVPGESEAFYVGPPSREKLPKSSTTGSVLHGSISYGTVSLERSKDDLRNQQSPVSYKISYIIPPAKVSEADEKESPVCTKRISERLKEEVRDMKLRFLSGLKRSTEEERLEWKELCASLKEEYPKYTPLLAKILDGLVAGGAAEDNIAHQKEIVAAANEVIDSVDQDELARFFSVKLDSEDEEAENIKKKMELTRDQLAEALYQKGLVLAEIESLEVIREKQSSAVIGHSNSFEENFKELKKWVDVRSPKYCMLSIVRERRNQRLGTALKLLCDVLIQEDSNPPKRRFYDLKIQLLEEIGWVHLVSYEKQWIHVRFPSSPFVF